MPVPLNVQLFDAFLGEQEGIHSVILPDIFSSGGSKNLYIDKYGRAKKISGYAQANSTAYLTHTGGDATLVSGLFPYHATGGGTTVRQLIGVFDDHVNEMDLAVSTNDGTTFTYQTALGSAPVGQVPGFAQFGDDLYLTTGKVAVKRYDGTSWATAGYTQSPKPTSSLTGSAGNLIGTYQYKLLSMIGNVRQIGSPASTALSAENASVSLTWSADSNTSVTGYELYRTTGTGAVYYFLTYIDGRTTAAASDNTDDLTILESRVMEEHGDPPPQCYFCTPHKQRMWWANTDSNPTRAYWSDPSLPESVLTDNFLDFSDSDTVGDKIIGMAGNQEGRLIVFTEKAVWAVSGTGEIIGNIVDWTKIRTDAQIGSVQGRTAVRVPGGAKYPDQNGKIQLTSSVTLAYLTPYNDIRIFDGNNDIIISHPKATTLQGINYAARNKCFAILDGERGEVSWVFPSGSATEGSTAVVWNYTWGVWYARDWGFASAAVCDNTSTSSFIMVGSPSTATGGHVYQLWSGNSFNGAAIVAHWMTKTLYGVKLVNYNGQPAVSETKTWRWVDFLFQTEQTAMLTVEWMPGGSPDDAAGVGSILVSPAASVLLSADGSMILSADGSQLTVNQQSSLIKVILKDSSGDYLHNEGIRLRIGDNSSNGSWALEAMNLAYQIMPGLQRGMQ